MATGDIQIQVAGTAPVPLSYTIPGNGQLRPKVINATFNGTGAATPFLPTVEIVSDGGVVVARCPADPVAAGASAEASFFPGIGGGAGTAVSIGGHGVSLWQKVANPASINDAFVYSQALSFDTVFYDTDGYYNALTPTRITIPAGLDGVYLFRGEIGYGVTAAGDYGLAIVPDGSLAGAPPHWLAEQQQATSGSFHAVLNIAAVQPMLAGHYVELYSVQHSGAARAIDPTASFLEAILLNIPPPWVTGS